jgi:hypothetical protein
VIIFDGWNGESHCVCIEQAPNAIGNPMTGWGVELQRKSESVCVREWDMKVGGVVSEMMSDGGVE